MHALLEFTGCYLLFAFAVGAAAAAERERNAPEVEWDGARNRHNAGEAVGGLP